MTQKKAGSPHRQREVPYADRRDPADAPPLSPHASNSHEPETHKNKHLGTPLQGEKYKRSQREKSVCVCVECVFLLNNETIDGTNETIGGTNETIDMRNEPGYGINYPSCNTESTHEMNITCSSSSESKLGSKFFKNASGRRVVSIQSLVNGVEEVSLHSKTCRVAFIQLDYERRCGFKTELIFQSICGWVSIISSESNKNSLPINDSFALGCEISPVGFNAASVLFTTMDLPVPDYKTFKNSRR